MRNRKLAGCGRAQDTPPPDFFNYFRKEKKAENKFLNKMK
jgi:hypothetical protein